MGFPTALALVQLFRFNSSCLTLSLPTASKRSVRPSFVCRANSPLLEETLQREPELRSASPFATSPFRSAPGCAPVAAAEAPPLQAKSTRVPLKLCVFTSLVLPVLSELPELAPCVAAWPLSDGVFPVCD